MKHPTASPSRLLPCALALCAVSVARAAAPAEITVPMRLADEKGVGKPVGSISVSKSKYGLVFTPDLQGLPSGVHGFHVHANGRCEPKVVDGMTAAGDHDDPEKAGGGGDRVVCGVVG